MRTRLSMFVLVAAFAATFWACAPNYLPPDPNQDIKSLMSQAALHVKHVSIRVDSNLMRCVDALGKAGAPVAVQQAVLDAGNPGAVLAHNIGVLSHQASDYPNLTTYGITISDCASTAPKTRPQDVGYAPLYFFDLATDGRNDGAVSAATILARGATANGTFAAGTLVITGHLDVTQAALSKAQAIAIARNAEPWRSTIPSLQTDLAAYRAALASVRPSIAATEH